MNEFNEDLIADLKKAQDLDTRQLARYVELMTELNKKIDQRLQVINYLVRMELDK
jgi:hypothetical protein